MKAHCAKGRRRILLLTMPLADPSLPNLAIEQLAAIARSQGEDCDVLYGTLRLPPSVPYNIIHGMFGPAIFTPSYFVDAPDDLATSIAHELIRGHRDELPDPDELAEGIAVDFLLGMEAAETCLRRCLNAIPVGGYDVVGFSVGFDAQKLPSAALARRLKEREPGIRLLFGGTGCDGEMGRALMEVFPEVDAIVQGEAEATFLPAVAALRGEGPFAAAHNCLYRLAGRILATAPAPPTPSLDEVPPPDYRAYLAQRDASPYKGLKKTLLFETSRGCWWGIKHHCLFCGIQAVDYPFRQRSARQTVAQIKELWRLYSPDVLYATDSILSIDHLESVMPELARTRREDGTDFNFFYEIKSNLRREHLALLSAAGVRSVQPGIEAFSTNSLRLMKKGASALQQVELLKWAQAYDIELSYSLLVGTPGETAQDLDEMLGLMRTLYHLPPPFLVNRLALHRFSPYADAPQKYGLRDVRPFPAQRLTYHTADDSLLSRLCYELNYNLDEHERPEVMGAFRRLIRAVDEWRRTYYGGERLVVSKAEGKLVVVRRSTDGPHIRVLDGDEAALYDRCEHATSLGAVSRETGIRLQALSAAADRLASESLLANLDGKCLALAVPAGVDGWRDSGLGEGRAPLNGSNAANLVQISGRGVR
jgi:ribosomal peptide maturation radical SAM protein 1